MASLIDLNNSILLSINVEWESNKILIVFRLREYLIMIKTQECVDTLVINCMIALVILFLSLRLLVLLLNVTISVGWKVKGSYLIAERFSRLV